MNIAKIDSLAEAVKAVLSESASKILSEGYGDAQYGPAARNAEKQAGWDEREKFSKDSKKSYEIGKEKEDKKIDSLVSNGFKKYKDRSEEVLKLLKPGIQIAWESDVFVKKRYGPIPPAIAFSGETQFAKAYKPKKLTERDFRFYFKNVVGNVWIKI